MGEGGALLIRDEANNIRSEIIREKGTNRAEFLLGMVDKYTWVSEGSSYLPSELGAAFLYGQLLEADNINDKRLKIYNSYNRYLKDLEDREFVKLPVVPEHCRHNAHMFYLKVKDIVERTVLIEYLKSNGVLSVFHYVPLHSSPFGLKCSSFCGEDIYTTSTSETLVRLPMYMDMNSEDVELVCDLIHSFYKGK